MRKTVSEERAVRWFFVIVAIKLTAVSMYIPLLPFFMIEELGLGPSSVGLALAFFSLMQLLSHWVVVQDVGRSKCKVLYSHLRSHPWASLDDGCSTGKGGKGHWKRDSEPSIFDRQAKE